MQSWKELQMKKKHPPREQVMIITHRPAASVTPVVLISPSSTAVVESPTINWLHKPSLNYTEPPPSLSTSLLLSQSLPPPGYLFLHYSLHRYHNQIRQLPREHQNPYSTLLLAPCAYMCACVSVCVNCSWHLETRIPFDCFFWCFDLFKPTDDWRVWVCVCVCVWGMCVCTACVRERFLNYPAPS